MYTIIWEFRPAPQRIEDFELMPNHSLQKSTPCNRKAHSDHSHDNQKYDVFTVQIALREKGNSHNKITPKQACQGQRQEDNYQ